MEASLLIIAALIMLPLIWAIATYNKLVSLRNHIRDAWANIDTELNRRYDLIPNLVAAVKGYAAHERETLQQVTDLRNTALADRGTVSHQEESEVKLVRALRKLIAVAEAYPDLKADQHFLELQRELVNTEDRIQASRRFYNGNVRDFRNLSESFPSRLIAAWFGFESADFFNVDPAVRAVPKVDSLS